jgi:hypothetical protein
MAMQAPTKRPLQVSVNGSGGRMRAHGIGSTGKLRVLRIEVRMEAQILSQMAGVTLVAFTSKSFEDFRRADLSN